MDIYHLTREIEASDMSALEAVISCDEERLKLEKEAEALAAQVCLVVSNLFCSTFCVFGSLAHLIVGGLGSRMMGVVKHLNVFMNDWKP